MDWNEVNWEILERLRDRFLEDGGAGDDYWRTRQELEHYDLAFAPRIGWKWDAVLGELRGLGWSPPEGATLWDWGCGTAIASRHLLALWEPGRWRELWLTDRSALAREYAATRARELGIATRTPALAEPPPEPYVLLLSHVMGELREIPMKAIERAQTVIWVEPGTPPLSRALVELRERLRGHFEVLAPCPHQAACGLAPGRRPRDWCHFFAPVPAVVFQSAHWEQFSRRLGIDRRSLPVSYLALRRPGAGAMAAAANRVIGRARVHRGFAEYLLCTADGVSSGRALKKDDKTGFRRWDEPAFRRSV